MKMDIFDEPGFINELLEICLEQAVLFAGEQVKAGADFIGVGDAAFYIRYIIHQYNSIMSDLYFFNRMSVKFNSVNDSVDTILSISQDYSKAEGLTDTMEELAADARTIEERLNYTGNWVLVSGLRGLLETYSGYASGALAALRERKSYLEPLTNSRMVAKFVNRRINEIVSKHLNQSSILYSRIEKRSRDMQVYIGLAILTVFVFSISIIFYFANGISKPIRSLAKRAEKIAAGDLDVSDVIVSTNDEISLLSNSFNKMSSNIRNLIHEILEKADVERKLKEEEMKNLKVTNILKETELKALQAQVNPHFLFNTLNTIARMAMLENADTTLNLIESTSELLRYNLGKIKQGTVTLRDEIDNVREYIFIQQMRFSDRIAFEFDIDEEVLDISVPYLFLQPLVENAIIHGIEPMEGKGTLTLKVYRKEDTVLVEIKDNGLGISEEKLESIFNRRESESIGLNNVKKRLEYYFNRSDLIQIYSKIGEGTNVTVAIPLTCKDGAQNV